MLHRRRKEKKNQLHREFSIDNFPLPLRGADGLEQTSGPGTVCTTYTHAHTHTYTNFSIEIKNLLLPDNKLLAEGGRMLRRSTV